MRHRLWLLLVLLIWTCPPSSAQDAAGVTEANAAIDAGATGADVTTEADVTSGSFQMLRKKDGRRLCWSDWEVRRNGPLRSFYERGEGTCQGYSYPVAWESETHVSADNPEELRESVRRIYTADRGRTLRTTWRHFDPLAHTVTARVVDPKDGGRARSRRWDGFSAITTPTSLLLVVREQLRQGRLPSRVRLVTGEPSLYTIRCIPRGRERVTVPAGTFECRKVELQVELGKVLSVLRPVLPKLYVWFTEAPPHHWIRYEGLEDGLRSPRIVIERTSPVDQVAGISTFAEPGS
jgi:hypothetical protein